jgi:hypothetical protein
MRPEARVRIKERGPRIRVAKWPEDIKDFRLFTHASGLMPRAYFYAKRARNFR